ncbi:MAG: FAD/NAD(P)-binding protein [Candidatus Margulisbacteria bacterium]|nr:FAD/NAD(P)-binding protein [Candidatus Margulisiibacteriota bacterium]MBU1617390.1 FAD/NAD(P)-binding protein [Candidatus Margulisiibacteriota bacterium]
MSNPYQPIKAEIKKVIVETPQIKTFVLEPEKGLPFLSGQFMQVTVPGVGECPFTPSSDPKNSETIEFTVMKTGQATGAMHELKPGEMVGLRGPFGRPYPLPDFHGKDIYIIGGGVGIAPLRALLLALFHELDQLNKIELRLGARSPDDLPFKKEMADWGKREKTSLVLTVDRGSESWTGKVGVVTGIMQPGDVKPDLAVAIVCGPPVMMKFATKKLLDLGIGDKNIYLSMEKNMSCGIGKCFHCNLGSHLCCKDGPVFTWEQVKEIPDPW